MVSDVTSVIFSWNYRFSKFSVPWHGSLFVPSSGVTHLFGDMTPRIESHMWENNGKNTVGPNELTDFEKFDVEQPDGPKTILATNSPNHPGDGITLRRNRSSSHFRANVRPAVNRQPGYRRVDSQSGCRIRITNKTIKNNYAKSMKITRTGVLPKSNTVTGVIGRVRG